MGTKLNSPIYPGGKLRLIGSINLLIISMSDKKVSAPQWYACSQ